MNQSPDLLPDSVIARRYASSRLKAWGGVWILLVGVTTYFCLVQRSHMQDLQSTAQNLSRQAAPLRELLEEQQKMQEKVAAIRARESWMMESDSQQTLQLLGIISHTAAKNRGHINVQNFALSTITRVLEPESKTKSRRKEKQKVEQRMQLELDGVAVDDLAVASFVAGLRESGVFENVELRSSNRQVRENHEIREYKVSCIY